MVHDELIKTFIKYLKERFDCIVVSQADLTEMTRQSVNVYDQLADADSIIIIQSEATYRLYSAYKMECICNFSREFGDLNESFVSNLSKLFNEQRPNFINKSFVIQFDCTLNKFVITNSLIKFKLYKFIEEMQTFEQNLQRELNKARLKSVDN